MSSSASSKRQRPIGEAGTGTVEFTVIAAVLMSGFLAIVELARYEAAVGALRAATAETARAALVDASLEGCAAPELRAMARGPGLEAERLSVCVRRSTAGGLQQLRVEASYDFAFTMPLFGDLTRRLTDVSVIRF